MHHCIGICRFGRTCRRLSCSDHSPECEGSAPSTGLGRRSWSRNRAWRGCEPRGQSAATCWRTSSRHQWADLSFWWSLEISVVPIWLPSELRLLQDLRLVAFGSFRHRQSRCIYQKYLWLWREFQLCSLSFGVSQIFFEFHMIYRERSDTSRKTSYSLLYSECVGQGNSCLSLEPYLDSFKFGKPLPSIWVWGSWIEWTQGDVDAPGKFSSRDWMLGSPRLCLLSRSVEDNC